MTGQLMSMSYQLIHLSAVSACHGAGDDPISPKCYPSRFFEWWNSVFPHPASELTNGAMRRTNSAYFSFCSSHHIPDVTDLVIIELDVDDSSCVTHECWKTQSNTLESPTEIQKQWKTLNCSSDLFFSAQTSPPF